MDLLEPQCAATSIGVANPLMIHLVTTLLTSYCNTSTPDSWPEDYGPVAIDTGPDTYDFIIIGAGTAGAVVANRLSENPTQKVLLIEAGGDPPIESEIPGLSSSLHGTDYDWNYPTKSNPNSSCLAMNDETCIWPRGKILGGSSSINSMLYVRGNAGDYDEWEQLGNPSWGWDTVLKYFKFSQNFKGNDRFNAHGSGGPMNIEPFRAPRRDQTMIIRASKELGYPQVEDFVNGNDVGFGYLYGTLEKGRRVSTAKAYLRVERDNLHVVKNAVAKRINFNANKTAISVTFVIDEVHELTMNATKEIILSAGSIESPKLLMLSGIGPRPLLTRMNIPLVRAAPIGDNLQDHTAVTLFLRIENGATLNETTVLDGVYDQWIHQVGPLGIGMMNLGAFVKTKNNADPHADVQFQYLNIANFQRFGAQYKPEIRQSIRHQIGPKDRLLAVYVSLLHPKSRGRIRLASADYKEKPLIFTNSLSEAEDMQTLIRGIKKQLEFEDTAVFKNRKAKFIKIDIPECNTHPYQSDAYWECYVRYMTTTTHDQVGTVKMGPITDQAAIVDHHLRVRGVRKLRVIDSSIMPNIICGNTYAPTIMIGEKGADYIKSTWNLRSTLKL